jgi:hypothetical protein
MKMSIKRASQNGEDVRARSFLFDVRLAIFSFSA